MAVRDAVDSRVVEDVRVGRTRIVDHPDQVGGWPTLRAGIALEDSDHDGMPDKWEKEAGSNWKDDMDGSKDNDGDGYTNLEDYLNGTHVGKKEPANQPDAGDGK